MIGKQIAHYQVTKKIGQGGMGVVYKALDTHLDREKIAYYGLSWGAELGAILPAVESRLKASVLIAGGFSPQRALPEVDQINFAPRVKIPTLMLNGRYDAFYTGDTYQIPMFRLLGTPRDHKVHKMCESATRPRFVNSTKRRWTGSTATSGPCAPGERNRACAMICRKSVPVFCLLDIRASLGYKQQQPI